MFKMNCLSSTLQALQQPIAIKNTQGKYLVADITEQSKTIGYL